MDDQFGTHRLLAVAVTYSTANALLIPTVVLLGSFLVPVSFVCWAFERRNSGEITAEVVFRRFLVGGVLGVLGASVLETYLLRPSPWLFVGVGLIEEAVKLAALALLTRGLLIKSTRDGIILGAVVGFGFAAFGSSGYVLVAAFHRAGIVAYRSRDHRVSAWDTGPRSFQDRHVSLRILKGRCMLRPAERVASVMSRRPVSRIAPMARLPVD